MEVFELILILLVIPILINDSMKKKVHISNESNENQSLRVTKEGTLMVTLSLFFLSSVTVELDLFVPLGSWH